MTDYKKLYEDKLNERYNAWLDSMPFPCDGLPKDFGKWLQCAILEQTQFTLSCSWNTYKNLYMGVVGSFTYLDMVNACNAIQFSKPLVFTMSPNWDDDSWSYIVIQEATQKIAALYDQLTKEKRQQFEKECADEVEKIYKADVRKATIKNSLTK